MAVEIMSTLSMELMVPTPVAKAMDASEYNFAIAFQERIKSIQIEQKNTCSFSTRIVQTQSKQNMLN